MKKEIVVLVGLLAGCATSQGMQDNVRKRASFDLNCASDKITVVEIEPPTFQSRGSQGSWGARGCGQQATYVQVGGGNTIVQNSAGSQPTQTEPPKQDGK